MKFYLISPLIAVALNLALVILILREFWRVRGQRVFVFFLLGMALWGAAIFQMRSSPTLEGALLWDKLVVIDFAFIAVLYLHFTYAFSGIVPRRWVLPLGYSFAGAMIFPTVLGYTVIEMQRNFYGYAPVVGPAFYPLLVFIYLTIGIASANVLQTARHSASPALRNRAVYLLMGTACSLLGGITDYLAAIGLPLYPLGIWGNIMFALLATIATVKSHLADIRQTLRRSFTYTIFIGLVVIDYIVVALVARYLFHVNFDTTVLIFTSVFLVAMVTALPRLIDRVQRWVDRSFYRQRYGPLQTLEHFGQEMKDITDLKSLAHSLVSLVQAATQAQFVSLLQPQNRRRLFRSSVTVGTEEWFQFPYNDRDTVLGRLAREDKVFLAEEVSLFPEWQAIRAEERAKIEATKVSLYVPVKSKGELTALLILGPKVRGNSYGQQDIDLLQAVAHQAATSMENARLYQELQEQLQELKEAQAQLIQSAKLASVGTLAAGVAHEVNNPIFAISGRAELLLDDPDRHLKTEKAKEYVSVIYEMSQRVSRIVRELLAFSRQDDTLAPHNLNDIVEKTLSLLEHDLVLAGIEVKREYRGDLPLVIGNSNQLQQVVMNLVLNAKDAMPGGGSLTLGTRLEDGSVVLSCIDTGEGIPQDRLGHIFDAFYTTKEVGKGTGLGLYICQRVIREHGGRIAVKSTVRKGTTFTIFLPLGGLEVIEQERKEVQSGEAVVSSNTGGGR